MKRLTTIEFIEKAKAVHGDKYDYSKVAYVNNHTKVCIVCPKHGEFWQEPGNHLKGCECGLCAQEKRNMAETYSISDFIKKAKAVHGDKYDYSKSRYTGCYKKLKITCPQHGDFWQSAAVHMQGYGCPRCGNSQRYTTKEWVDKAKIVHGDKYDYSVAEYVNAKTKVRIICHNKDKSGNEHGEFMQLPINHIKGQGCPKCKSYRLESDIRAFLIDNGMRYEEHKSFSWLKNKTGSKTLDFYLPDYSAAIECQGIQHFFPTDFANKGEEWANNKFDYTLKNDEFKRLKCKEMGIEIYYYSDLGINYPYEVFEDKNKLLKIIKNNGTNCL